MLLRIWLRRVPYTYTGTVVYLYGQWDDPKARLSGTIPSQLGDIAQLQELWLYGNSISGTIPAEMGKLSQLERLNLFSNSISGTIPSQLASLASLEVLDVGNNRLAYPRSSEARVDYDLATRICRGAGSVESVGVPPDSCSAFADAQLSVTDPNECVVCDNQTASLIVVGVCILVGIIALAAFVRFVVRNPWALKRLVSTAAILFNHAQTASIVASMRLEWPRSLIAITSALKLDLLMLPSASCLVGGGDESAFDYHALCASSAMLVSLLAPLLVKYVALCCRRLAIADTAELVLSLIYSLLFTFAWSLVLELVAYEVGPAEMDRANHGYAGLALFTMAVLGGFTRYAGPTLGELCLLYGPFPANAHPPLARGQGSLARSPMPIIRLAGRAS